MLILASSSPRRRELLNNMGIRDFEIRPSDAEPALDHTLPPPLAVQNIALAKALSVSRTCAPGDIVIAADTMVFVDDQALGKPRSEAEAKNMLRALSGCEHHVITGLVVIADGVQRHTAVSTAVRFSKLDDHLIDWYVSTGEPMDKAGAYGIQGLGGMLIEGITGDYFNVMGLPIHALAGLLSDAGYPVFGEKPGKSPHTA